MPSGTQIFGALAAMGAAVVVVAGGIGAGIGSAVTSNNTKSTGISVKLSPAYNQLLDQNLAGSRTELETYLTQQANQYFAEKGVKCNYGAASSTAGEALKRAQTPCPAR